VFDFGNVPVAPGSRITFTQAVTSGAGGVVFDAGAGPCAGVTETDGTAPLLSTVRDNSVGLQILGEPSTIASATTVSCPVSTNGSSDRLDRGFYVSNYPGVTIHTVTLYHSTDTPGVKTLSLIARLGSFNGPLVGVAPSYPATAAAVALSGLGVASFHPRAVTVEHRNAVIPPFTPRCPRWMCACRTAPVRSS